MPERSGSCRLAYPISSSMRLIRMETRLRLALTHDIKHIEFWSSVFLSQHVAHTHSSICPFLLFFSFFFNMQKESVVLRGGHAMCIRYYYPFLRCCLLFFVRCKFTYKVTKTFSCSSPLGTLRWCVAPIASIRCDAMLVFFCFSHEVIMSWPRRARCLLSMQ